MLWADFAVHQTDKSPGEVILSKIASCCHAGNARLSLTVRKAKMDYRGSMEKPFFTLSIRARGGTPLELSQDTAPGMFANGVMHLDHTLVLSTPIEKIPQGKLQPSYMRARVQHLLADLS